MRAKFGTNQAAERINVYYTGTSTIYEGMPLCYVFDTTTSMVGTIASGTKTMTIAEGSQCDGKYLRVENPDADNIHAFAGVVAGSAWNGLSGPRHLDIYTPNGAIVPVRTDLNCTVGRTIMAIHTAETILTSPHETAGRPVAIAWETVDRSSTTGITLARLDPSLFIWQQGDATKLLVDDQDTTSAIKLNKIYASTAQTGGRFMALDIQVALTGTPACTGYGYCLYTQLDIDGIPTGQNAGVSHWTNFNAGGDYASSYYGVEIGIYEGGADLSGIAGSDVLAPLCLRVQLDSTDGCGSGTTYQMYLRAETSGDYPDGLFACYTAHAINMQAKSAAAVTHCIPIKMIANMSGGPALGTYYIMVSDTL